MSQKNTRIYFLFTLSVFFISNIFLIQQSFGEETILSPKKQVIQGTQPEAVKCNEGFYLIIKYDYSPACVRPETAEKLLERGWGYWPVACCKPVTVSNFKSFEECVAAGNMVLEEYDPPQCRASDGKHYVKSPSNP